MTIREPLVRRQGSQVSMRVARGSASWLSSEKQAEDSSFEPLTCKSQGLNCMVS